MGFAVDLVVSAARPRMGPAASEGPQAGGAAGPPARPRGRMNKATSIQGNRLAGVSSARSAPGGARPRPDERARRSRCATLPSSFLSGALPPALRARGLRPLGLPRASRGWRRDDQIDCRARRLCAGPSARTSFLLKSSFGYTRIGPERAGNHVIPPTQKRKIKKLESPARQSSRAFAIVRPR